ncbi:MAG: hypothetical protein GY952_17170 [Rhodobacteraceae bacterium]|nr:hypothetical protein [Paracoccaceae bacterium]
MKMLHLLLFTTLALFANQAAAHVGPEKMNLHFIEHLLIAMAIGLPSGYGLFRLLQRSGDPNR